MCKKIIAYLTVISFVYSSVGAPCVQGAIDLSASAQTTSQLKKAVNSPLPAVNLDIPMSLGRVTGGNDRGGNMLVVNIQDLHCHPEVQRNINAILGFLDNKYGLKKVFIEGGYGRLDTSWLNTVTGPAVKKQALDALLENGRLTGSEYYSMAGGRYDILQGLEDEKLHKANIVRLGKILDKKQQYEVKLKALNRGLDLMQAKYLTPENKRFNRILAKHTSGAMSDARFYALLNTYVEKINEHPEQYHNILPVNENSFPAIQAYRETLELQKHLRYNRIGVQMQGFLQVLKTRLPYAVYNTLLQKTDNLSRADLTYPALAQMAEEYQLDTRGRFPDLARYFSYIEKSRSVNPMELVKETQRLTEQLRAAFSRDAAERDVSFLADFFGCFEDYLLNRLSAEDYAYFKARFEKFTSTWGKYTYKNHILDLAEDFPLLDDYYAANVRRNTVFLENMLAAAPATPSRNRIAGAPEVVVMISGGFHTAGMTRLLDERKISHCTITPNVTRDAAPARNFFESTVRYQAKLFGAQALSATPLVELDPRVTANAKGEITVTIRGGAQFTIVDNQTLVVAGDAASALDPHAYTGINAHMIKRKMLMMAAMITTRQTPLVIAPAIMYEAINSIAVSLANTGITGDGLIWKIASDPAVQEAIMQYLRDENAVEELSEWLAPMQDMVAGRAIASAELRALYATTDSALLKAVLSVPGVIETLAVIYGSLESGTEAYLTDAKIYHARVTGGKKLTTDDVEEALQIAAREDCVFVLDGTMLIAHPRSLALNGKDIYGKMQELLDIQRRAVAGPGMQAAAVNARIAKLNGQAATVFYAVLKNDTWTLYPGDRLAPLAGADMVVLFNPERANRPGSPKSLQPRTVDPRAIEAEPNVHLLEPSRFENDSLRIRGTWTSSQHNPYLVLYNQYPLDPAHPPFLVVSADTDTEGNDLSVPQRAVGSAGIISDVLQFQRLYNSSARPDAGPCALGINGWFPNYEFNAPRSGATQNRAHIHGFHFPLPVTDVKKNLLGMAGAIEVSVLDDARWGSGISLETAAAHSDDLAAMSNSMIEKCKDRGHSFIALSLPASSPGRERIVLVERAVAKPPFVDASGNEEYVLEEEPGWSETGGMHVIREVEHFLKGGVPAGVEDIFAYIQGKIAKGETVELNTDYFAKIQEALKNTTAGKKEVEQLARESLTSEALTLPSTYRLAARIARALRLSFAQDLPADWYAPEQRARHTAMTRFAELVVAPLAVWDIPAHLFVSIAHLAHGKDIRKNAIRVIGALGIIATTAAMAVLTGSHGIATQIAAGLIAYIGFHSGYNGFFGSFTKTDAALTADGPSAHQPMQVPALGRCLSVLKAVDASLQEKVQSVSDLMSAYKSYTSSSQQAILIRQQCADNPKLLLLLDCVRMSDSDSFIAHIIAMDDGSFASLNALAGRYKKMYHAQLMAPYLPVALVLESIAPGSVDHIISYAEYFDYMALQVMINKHRTAIYALLNDEIKQSMENAYALILKNTAPGADFDYVGFLKIITMADRFAEGPGMAAFNKAINSIEPGDFEGKNTVAQQLYEKLQATLEDKTFGDTWAHLLLAQRADPLLSEGTWNPFIAHRVWQALFDGMRQMESILAQKYPELGIKLYGLHFEYPNSLTRGDIVEGSDLDFVTLIYEMTKKPDISKIEMTRRDLAFDIHYMRDRFFLPLLREAGLIIDEMAIMEQSKTAWNHSRPDGSKHEFRVAGGSVLYTIERDETRFLFDNWVLKKDARGLLQRLVAENALTADEKKLLARLSKAVVRKAAFDSLSPAEWYVAESLRARGLIDLVTADDTRRITLLWLDEKVNTIVVRAGHPDPSQTPAPSAGIMPEQMPNGEALTLPSTYRLAARLARALHLSFAQGLPADWYAPEQRARHTAMARFAELVVAPIAVWDIPAHLFVSIAHLAHGKDIRKNAIRVIGALGIIATTAALAVLTGSHGIATQIAAGLIAYIGLHSGYNRLFGSLTKTDAALTADDPFKKSPDAAFEAIDRCIAVINDDGAVLDDKLNAIRGVHAIYSEIKRRKGSGYLVDDVRERIETDPRLALLAAYSPQEYGSVFIDFMRVVAQMPSLEFAQFNRAVGVLSRTYQETQAHQSDVARSYMATQFENRELPMLLIMESILPGSIMHVADLLRSTIKSGDPDPMLIRRFLDSKRAALADRRMVAVLSFSLWRIRDNRTGRKKIVINPADFFKIINMADCFVQSSATQDMEDVVGAFEEKDASVAALIDKLYYRLSERLVQSMAKDAGVVVGPTAFKSLYLPFLPRLFTAKQCIAESYEDQLPWFEGVVKATLEGRFWDFIENVSQDDATGKSIAVQNERMRALMGRAGIHADRYIGRRDENRFLPKVFSYNDKQYSLRPMRRDPGHDLFIGDFTDCCLAMSSDEAPQAMVQRLIDETMNVIEVLNEKGMTMACLWLYLADDGSLVIQNIEIAAEYERDQLFKDMVAREMIEYAREFAQHINAPRLLIGKTGHGKYFEPGEYVNRIFARNKAQKEIPFEMGKLGGYFANPGGQQVKYYLVTANKPTAYLVTDNEQYHMPGPGQQSLRNRAPMVFRFITDGDVVEPILSSDRAAMGERVFVPSLWLTTATGLRNIPGAAGVTPAPLGISVAMQENSAVKHPMYYVINAGNVFLGFAEDAPEMDPVHVTAELSRNAVLWEQVIQRAAARAGMAISSLPDMTSVPPVVIVPGRAEKARIAGGVIVVSEAALPKDPLKVRAMIQALQDQPQENVMVGPSVALDASGLGPDINSAELLKQTGTASLILTREHIETLAAHKGSRGLLTVSQANGKFLYVDASSFNGDRDALAAFVKEHGLNGHYESDAAGMARLYGPGGHRACVTVAVEDLARSQNDRQTVKIISLKDTLSRGDRALSMDELMGTLHQFDAPFAAEALKQSIEKAIQIESVEAILRAA